jgi:hypothetical protein
LKEAEREPIAPLAAPRDDALPPHDQPKRKRQGAKTAAQRSEREWRQVGTDDLHQQEGCGPQERAGEHLRKQQKHAGLVG